MTLNGRNEIDKNSGAHQKNFNEDKPMSVVAKCRPMHLFVIYKVYADTCRGSIGGEDVKYNISGNGLRSFSVENLYEAKGTRRCELLVTKLFAALGLRDTEDCNDISLYQILR